MNDIITLYLDNFPQILHLWSSLLLAWGLFLAQSIRVIIKRINDRIFEAPYRNILHGIYLTIILLFLYIFLAPNVLYYIYDAMVVTNIFVQIFYTYNTYSFISWWKVMFNDDNNAELHIDY